MKHDIILDIKKLTVRYNSNENVYAVNDFSLSVKKNSILGIVGESGSGKSTILNAMMHFLPDGTDLCADAFFYGDTMIDYNECSQWSELLGKEIVFIPQNPKSALDPTYKIEKQLFEVFKVHNSGIPPKKIREQLVDLLYSVGIKEPEGCMKKYPHELSGGMCQRILIAMAMLAKPKLIMADEPTSALDPTIQAQIIKLFEKAKKQASVIFVTHDLSVASLLCDEICVMRSGKIVEFAKAENIFSAPHDQYTKQLLNAICRNSP